MDICSSYNPELLADDDPGLLAEVLAAADGRQADKTLDSPDRPGSEATAVMIDWGWLVSDDG